MISSDTSEENKVVGGDSRQPLSQHNSNRLSSPMEADSLTKQASPVKMNPRGTDGAGHLAEFLKEISSPAANLSKDIPSNRRRTIDLAAFKAILADDTFSPNSESATPTRSFNNDDVLALLRMASTPTSDNDDSIPLENRVVVDVKNLDSLFNKLSTKSPTTSVLSSSSSSKKEKKKRKSKSLESANDMENEVLVTESSKEEDEEEDDGRSNRRATLDPKEFLKMMDTTFSPAGSDVPPERRLTVDEESVEKMKEMLKLNESVDTGEFQELMRVALSPAVSCGGENDGKNNDSDDEVEADEEVVSKKRRTTLDPDSFALMLQQMSSPSGSSVAASPHVSNDEESSMMVATPKDSKRRESVDGAWLSEMLKQNISDDESSPFVSGVKKPRISIDADEMVKFMNIACAMSPDPLSPYVSPPLASRTRSATKSPKAASSSSLSSSSKKKTPESKKKTYKSPSSKKGRRSSVDSSPYGASNDSLHRVPSPKQTEPIQPVSALKSCLSVRKGPKNKTASTPSKAITFGLPNAAEFKQSDPSSALTPMHRNETNAFFPMTGGSDDSNDQFNNENDNNTSSSRGKSKKTESETLKNSRILSQIGHMDVLLNENGEKIVSPPSRRLSGKFTLPSKDEMIDEVNDSMEDSSDISDGTGLMPSNADLTGGYEDGDEVEGEDDENDEPTKNLNLSFHDTVDDDLMSDDDNLSLGAAMNEDRTMELEGNLNDFINNAENVSNVNDQMLNDDVTYQLENNLGSLVVDTPVLFKKSQKKSSSKRRGSSSGSQRGPFSATSSRMSLGEGEDKTVELENAFMDLLALTEGNVNAHSSSYVPDSEKRGKETQNMSEYSFSGSTPGGSTTSGVTPFKAPACPHSSKSSAMSHKNKAENNNNGDDDINHTSEAFGMLLKQAGNEEEMDLLASPTTQDDMVKNDKVELSLGPSVEVSNEEEEEEALPSHLIEYQKLLEGLGAENPMLEPTEPLNLTKWCVDDEIDMSYVCSLELELLKQSIEVLKKNVGLEAGDAMVERLWNRCKQHRLTTLGVHPTEKLLRVILKKLNGEDINNEDLELMEEAKLIIQTIQNNAKLEFQSFEYELAENMEKHYEEQVDFVSKEADLLRQARNEFELFEKKCDEEIQIQSSAIDFLKHKDENEIVSNEFADLENEVLLLEEELAKEEELARDASEKLSSLEAIKANKLELGSLIENNEKSILEADLALDDWNVSAGLRSWIPRELGSHGNVIVDFPLLPYHACNGDVSRLRLNLDCGTEGEHVQNIHWVVIASSSNSSSKNQNQVLSDLGHPSPFSKRHKSSMNHFNKKSSIDYQVSSNSIVNKLRDRLVNEWVGREAGRLKLHKANLCDVSKVLNRFDALVGRMNLVLDEVRKIESELGLFITFRDGEEGGFSDGDDASSHSAGLWLQIDMSSVKHHCKVRLEVRIVDGYPWAPSEVNLIEVLGEAPLAMKKSINSLRNCSIPNGTPILDGAGAIFSAVSNAYQHIA